jgi:hypothetical protein
MLLVFLMPKVIIIVYIKLPAWEIWDGAADGTELSRRDPEDAEAPSDSFGTKSSCSSPDAWAEMFCC